MHLRRGITLITVLATASAQPYAAFSHKQLFPLDGRQLPIKDAEPDQRATASSPASSAAASGKHAHSARPVADASDLDHGCDPIAQRQLTFRSGPAASRIAIRGSSALTLRDASAPATMTTSPRRRHALQKRAWWNPFDWDRELQELAARLAWGVFGVAAGIGIYQAVCDVALGAGVGALWASGLGLFLAFVGAALVIWFSGWVLDRARGPADRSRADTTSRLEESARRVAAAAGHKVRFVSAATKDALLERAKTGKQWQVVLG